jgi:ketosteroid isomerase-like protein
MPADNVAVVRSVYENFATGNIPAVLAVLAPQIEWVESPQDYLPWRGTHRSPAEVVPEHFHDAGDVVVVEGRAVGKSKRGGVLDAPACWVWTVRDGLVTANHNYHDTDAFRLAVSPE